MGIERDTLVIGYGNELRGDDAVGPVVARAVAAWQQPGLVGLDLPQLTPELADLVRGARVVIFVDAVVGDVGAEVRLESIEGRGGVTPDPHRSDPAGLMALAQSLYGPCPPAWLITIPIADTAFGDRLSSLARAGVEDALRKIQALVRETLGDPHWTPRSPAPAPEPEAAPAGPGPATPAPGGHEQQTEIDWSPTGQGGGFESWREQRQRAVQVLGKKLGLPLGHQVELWLRGGIRLRGRLRLREERLFLEDPPDPELEFEVDRVPFKAAEVESFVRLD